MAEETKEQWLHDDKHVRTLVGLAQLIGATPALSESSSKRHASNRNFQLIHVQNRFNIISLVMPNFFPHFNNFS